jgi:hypothetical protein
VRHETRINLIFLTVFLILAIPGAVMLVRKTLKAGGNRMSQPDAIVDRMPFMTPPPTPVGMKWIAPDLTVQWLRDFLEGRMPISSAPPGPKWEPVISEDHALQLMDASQAGDSWHLSMVLWQAPAFPNKDMFKLAAPNRAGQTFEITRADAADIPQAVRRELVSLGFTRPPQQVVWIEATTSKLSPGDEIQLTYPGQTGSARTSVHVPLK